PLSFFGTIVLVRDHQVCDLEPDVSFIFEPLEGVEHRIEMGKRNLVIEALREGFEIHVCCIDVAINLRPCLGGDVTRRNHDALQPVLPSKARDIDNEFPPDHRVVVSIRNTWNLMPNCQLHDFLWAGAETMRFVKLRLADAPVLTKATAEIAAGGAKAQHAGSGEEMIQGLFFDGIDSEAGGSAVAERIEFTPDVLTDVTEAGLAIAQTTETRT